MIVTTLIGGIGNQMFQYAAGRALALRLGLGLALDTSHYAKQVEHGYALSAFALPPAPEGAARMLPPAWAKRRQLRALWRSFGPAPRVFRERGFGYCPQFAQISGPVTLQGYWQSERYFADVTATIRADFRITPAPSPANARALAEIAATAAVSLHIRRGDYVRNPKFNAVHGTCTMEYYARAADLLAARMQADPVIFAFSDDPDWVGENLRLPFRVHVMGQNDASRNYEDLRLMAACRHHIIANSSFSWWGAWLNPDPGKIVVAPARWYADPTRSNPDILPASWQRL
jgi:hypothetical protein